MPHNSEYTSLSALKVSITNPLARFEGKPIPEVLAHAHEQVQAEMKSLEEGLQVYRLVNADPIIGLYLKGVVA